MVVYGLNIGRQFRIASRLYIQRHVTQNKHAVTTHLSTKRCSCWSNARKHIIYYL